MEAEGVGFEPTVPFGTPVFKTGAINHSTTPPGGSPKARLSFPCHFPLQCVSNEMLERVPHD